MLLVFLLIMTNFKSSNGFNIDLIFSLQENFHSDVILLPKQLGNEKIVKTLLQYQESQPKAFISLLDFSYNYKSYTDSPIFSGYQNKLVIIDYKSNFIKKLFQVQKTHPSIMTSFIWIYFIKTGDEKQNIELLNIPYDSKFFIIKKINSSNFEITDIYQITASSPKIYSRYALWENKELKLLRKHIFSSRKNLQGHQVKVAGPSEARQYKIFPYWHFLSDSLNFTLKETLINNLGASFKNGTKTGLVKLIYENLADVSHNFLFYASDRLNDFDFIPLVMVRIMLYVEVKQGLNWKAFITPFQIDIWISIIVWVIVAYVVVKISNRMISRLFIFEDPIFNFIRAFCNQGRDLRGAKFSFFIVALMPYILGIILFQYYSAELLTHLTIHDSTPPFWNFESVIDDGTYEISSVYPSYLWMKINDFIETETRKTIKLVPITFRDFSSGNFFHDLCSYRRVVATTLYNYDIRVNCNIVELPEAMYYLTGALMATKGFPYREMMTKLIRSFRAKGLSRLKSENVIKWDNDYIIQPIGLKIVFPAFLILIGFFFLSVMIFLFEIIIWKFKKWRNRNRITTQLKFTKTELQLDL